MLSAAVMLASFVSLNGAEPRGVEGALDSVKELSLYHTVFDSPSKDEADSVPLGNGVTGVNLWVEENGDLLFYVARNDAISEMHRLLKLGRVRVSLSPNPFRANQHFVQTLHLSDGICEIEAGQGKEGLTLKVWVDAESQVIYVSGDSDTPTDVTVSLENWRTNRKSFDPEEIGSTWIYRGGIPDNLTPNYEAADVVTHEADTVRWYHRNEHSPVPIHVEQMRLQRDADKIIDPILHRTFGGVLYGEGFVQSAKNTLGKWGARQFEIRVATESLQSQSVKDYNLAIDAVMESAVSANVAEDRTRAWWNAFWGRSWIFVKESPALIIPANKLPLHFGAGRDGMLPIGGEFRNVAIHDGGLDQVQIKQSASVQEKESKPIEGESIVEFQPVAGAHIETGELGKGYLAAKASADVTFPRGFTVEAFIKPERAGRIFDKVLPGGSNGYLLDLYEGKLRLIVGNNTLYSTKVVPTGQWSHVAAVCRSSGELEIYLNGERVDERAEAVVEAQSTKSDVTQAYILTKYQFACQQRSVFPSHFNGGIFNVAPEFAYYATDPRGKHWTADYRFYGPNFWWQNTRFMYQLHLAQGNDDLLDSFFEFYFGNLSAFRSMAKRHFNANGIFMYETISHFGLPGMGDFGWNQEQYSEGYTKNIWQQCLELGAFALDRYDYTGDRAFLKRAIDWCDQSLRFYDTRFKKGKDGKIVIFPTHGVETYWYGVTGDTPSIAGLLEITRRLLALPSDTTTQAQRNRWQTFAECIPALPKKKDENGDIVPDVAQKYDPRRGNYEAPEMYGVYPFRHYGLNRQEHDIEEARRGWHRIYVKGHSCWYQTGVFAARLGMAKEAAEDVLIRTGKSTRLRVVDFPGRYFRFPGFFSSPHDWCPDYDGAGNMANTLQEMLIHQGGGNSIMILPAWPEHWDASFKLHAPGQTTVELEYKGGKLLKLEVTPESRRKDIVLPDFLKSHRLTVPLQVP